jgi:hypothetical protein
MNISFYVSERFDDYVCILSTKVMMEDCSLNFVINVQLSPFDWRNSFWYMYCLSTVTFLSMFIYFSFLYKKCVLLPVIFFSWQILPHSPSHCCYIWFFGIIIKNNSSVEDWISLKSVLGGGEGCCTVQYISWEVCYLLFS